MNVKWIAIGIFLLLVVGAGMYVASQGTEEATEVVTETATPTASTTATPGEQAASSTATQGKYLDYSDEVLAQTSGDRVLFFHAPWCPQCRSIESGIKQDGVPDGWTVIKVDYDSNQDLRRKYDVTQQTTFVKLDGSGNRAGDNYVAYEQPTFDSVVANFLNR